MMFCVAVDSRCWQWVAGGSDNPWAGVSGAATRGGARNRNGGGEAERAESRTARRRKLQARDWWQGR